jgi:hypothetical protein
MHVTHAAAQAPSKNLGMFNSINMMEKTYTSVQYYRSKKDKRINVFASLMYVSVPKTIVVIPRVNPPTLYIIFGPIILPMQLNIGQHINAVRFTMPNTKPY